MVTFQETMGGYDVSVNEKPFGHISQERGFFTDSTVIQCFVEVSAKDLEAILKKTREVTLATKGTPDVFILTHGEHG